MKAGDILTVVHRIGNTFARQHVIAIEHPYIKGFFALVDLHNGDRLGTRNPKQWRQWFKENEKAWFNHGKYQIGKIQERYEPEYWPAGWLEGGKIDSSK